MKGIFLSLKNNPAILIALLALLTIPLWFDLGFSDSEDIQKGGSTNYQEISEVAIVQMGEQEFTVKVARSNEERRLGLMHLTQLPKDRGMLFVFESDVTGGFWMKNTLIPLDIIYINASDEIVDIWEDAQPCPKVGECIPDSPSSPYRRVVEINAGLTEEFGIEVGDRVEIKE